LDWLNNKVLDRVFRVSASFDSSEWISHSSADDSFLAGDFWFITRPPFPGVESRIANWRTVQTQGWGFLVPTGPKPSHPDWIHYSESGWWESPLVGVCSQSVSVSQFQPSRHNLTFDIPAMRPCNSLMCWQSVWANESPTFFA
jgi:hypothetical protein